MKLLKMVHTVAAAVVLATTGAAHAQQEPIKIGLILPMTGPFASTGRQIEAGVKLFMSQNGNTIDGRKVELLLRDDAGVADNTRRLAQELITRDKAAVLAGFGLTPLALSVSQLITQSKTPAVIMAAATSTIPQTSPYFVRTSMVQNAVGNTMGEWAKQNGVKKVVTLVSDYGPGIDTEKSFKAKFEELGGTVVESLRVPLKSPDFAPFLQRVRDANPEAVFTFVPSGEGAALMKQFNERGLGKARIKLLGDGSVTDDDLMPTMDDAALGAITAFHYSTAHKSEANDKFVAAFKAANPRLRPNFMAVGGYDGMRVIYEGLAASKGAGGDALMEAMKGISFESPRGPIQIDPKTRDIVQNLYIRRVERQNGELYNVEFETFKPTK